MGLYIFQNTYGVTYKNNKFDYIYYDMFSIMFKDWLMWWLIMKFIIFFVFVEYRALMDSLQKLDMRFLTNQQKLAFWINMYNACIMHVS